MRILVTGGAGFVGSHVVDELVSRGHAVLVRDDLSTAELEEDGKTPRWFRKGAAYVDCATSYMKKDLNILEAVVHLALRHPLERERACWVAAFDGYVAGGVRLLMDLLNAGAPLKRFVFAGPVNVQGVKKSAEFSMVNGLVDLLGYWHRPPMLAVHCLRLPELSGERRAVPMPDGVTGQRVETAAMILANLADGTSPHHSHVEVHYGDA